MWVTNHMAPHLLARTGSVAMGNIWRQSHHYPRTSLCTGLSLGLNIDCVFDLHFKSHYSHLRWLLQSMMTELFLREDHGGLDKVLVDTV